MFSYLKKHKKGFTLVETILVCSIFAIMVIGIIAAINRAYTFMNNTRLQVRASNYAREGMEMMFNIRNSNRRKRAGLKDEHWLNLSVVDADNNLGIGLYRLEKLENGTGNVYSSATKIPVTNAANIEQIYSDDTFWTNLATNVDLQKTKITYSGTYATIERERVDYANEWTGRDTIGNLQDILGNEADFYRLVRVYGVYDKTGNDPQKTTTDITSSAKEIRFCVKVFYRASVGGEHSVELCSLMTNFED